MCANLEYFILCSLNGVSLIQFQRYIEPCDLLGMNKNEYIEHKIKIILKYI